MKRNLLQLLSNWHISANRQPLIVLGARQVGKTYLLNEFGRTFPHGVAEFNFEEQPSLNAVFAGDLDPQRIISELEFVRGEKIRPHDQLIIFDEIQECPRALTSLKYFAEKAPEYPICAAGSLLGLYLSAASFPVGKVSLLHLAPLSFEEFLSGVGDQKGLDALREFGGSQRLQIPEVVHQHLWGQLKRYLIIGGLPGVILKYSENQTSEVDALKAVRARQAELVVMYQADMAKHAGKVNAMHVDRLWRHVPAQLGASIDGSAPKFTFRGVIPGVAGYRGLVHALDWLENAGLLLRIPICNQAMQPLASFSKENFFKLFMFDVGLLGAMSGLQPKTIHNWEFGTYKGFFAENFVAQELATQGQKIFSWREATAEVEFLVDFDGQLVPIEVKSGQSTRSKSLKVFREKYRPALSILLSGKCPTGADGGGILRLPLYAAGQLPALAKNDFTLGKLR